MVDGGSPARDRSETEEYGRPAMIFFAVAGPTPGSVSKSFSEAELISTRETEADPLAVGGCSFFLAFYLANEPPANIVASRINPGSIFLNFIRAAFYRILCFVQ